MGKGLASLLPPLTENDRLRLIAALKSRPPPKTRETEDGLLAACEVAEVLRVSERTARNMMRHGELPSFRVKKKLWRMSRLDLSEYIRTQYEVERQRISPDDGIYPPVTSCRPPPK